MDTSEERVATRKTDIVSADSIVTTSSPGINSESARYLTRSFASCGILMTRYGCPILVWVRSMAPMGRMGSPDPGIALPKGDLVG